MTSRAKIADCASPLHGAMSYCGELQPVVTPACKLPVCILCDVIEFYADSASFWREQLCVLSPSAQNSTVLNVDLTTQAP